MVRNPEYLSAKEKDSLYWEYTGAVVSVGAWGAWFPISALFIALEGRIKGVNWFEERQTSSVGTAGSRRTELAEQ